MADRPRSDDALVAGRAALARGAWPEARALFEEALARGERPEPLEGLSWATWWLEDVATCLDARERAYRLYRAAGDRRSAARMALWLGDDHIEFRGEEAVAAGWFSRAARLLDGLEPCPEHGWLAVFEAHAALGRRELAAAIRLAEEARAAGRRHEAFDLEMFGLATEGVARVEQGELAVGMRCLDEASAAAIAGEYENLVPAAWSCCLLISSCEQVRDYERGAQWCEQIAAFSRRMQARFVTGACRAHYAAILTWHGSWRAAEQELVAALDDLGATRPAWRTEALVRLGELRLRQGRIAEAAELFEQAPEHPLSQRGLAAVRLERDDPATACDLLERMLRQTPDGAARRADALELLVRAELARGGHEAAAAWLEALRAVAAAVGTEPLRAATRVCEGLLAAAVGEHEVACDHFEDAIDILARGRAPLEAARTRVELAWALLALDRVEAAAHETRAALAVLDSAGAALDSARARTLLAALSSRGPHPGSGDAPLTARQVEVLRLVAEGLSDRDIADRLVLSEHTVHRHVANIYARLGCSSRAAAVAHAGRLGLL